MNYDICPECNSEVKDEHDTFCWFCGYDFDEYLSYSTNDDEAELEQESWEPVEQEMSGEQEEALESYYQEELNKSGFGCIKCMNGLAVEGEKVCVDCQIMLDEIFELKKWFGHYNNIDQSKLGELKLELLNIADLEKELTTLRNVKKSQGRGAVSNENNNKTANKIKPIRHPIEIANNNDDSTNLLEYTCQIGSIATIISIAIVAILGGGRDILVPLCILFLVITFVVPFLSGLRGTLDIYFTITRPRNIALKIQRQRERAEEIEQNRLRIIELKKENFRRYQRLRTEIQQIPRYKIWQEAIYNLYGRKCWKCGSNQNLEIHHNKSLYSIVTRFDIDSIEKASECSALWDLSNGSVLCHDCHQQMESTKYYNNQNKS